MAENTATIPLSEYPDDKDLPIYDWTKFAVAGMLDRIAACPICADETVSGGWMEKMAALCMAHTRYVWDTRPDKGPINKVLYYLRFKKVRKITCTTPGVHKHYTCPKCKSRGVVFISNTEASAR